MATIREYFDLDFKGSGSGISTTTPLDYRRALPRGFSDPRLVKILMPFQINARYLALFIPACENIVATVTETLCHPRVTSCTFQTGSMTFRETDHSPYVRFEDLVFTRKIFLYVDLEISSEESLQIAHLAKMLDFNLSIFDRKYAEEKSRLEKPLAFISHDSRDKITFVRPLVDELIKVRCPVWYDEYSMTPGDSLRENIEKGLKEAKKCILIISPNFISNERWAKAEYNALFSREMGEGSNIIIPIWHQVTEEQVREYCLFLSDRLAIDSSIGPKRLAQELAEILKN